MFFLTYPQSNKILRGNKAINKFFTKKLFPKQFFLPSLIPSNFNNLPFYPYEYLPKPYRTYLLMLSPLTKQQKGYIFCVYTGIYDRSSVETSSWSDDFVIIFSQTGILVDAINYRFTSLILWFISGGPLLSFPLTSTEKNKRTQSKQVL